MDIDQGFDSNITGFQMRKQLFQILIDCQAVKLRKPADGSHSVGKL